MVELVRKAKSVIRARPYRNGRWLKPVALADGLVVEEPTTEQRPKRYPQYLEVEGGCFVAAAGLFLLPSGDVAVVYGAEAQSIGD